MALKILATVVTVLMGFTPLMVFTLSTAFTLVPTGCDRVNTVSGVNTPSDTEARRPA